MEIELKKVIKTRNVISQTFTVCDGLEIFYLGVNYAYEDYPKRGIVKEEKGKFIIYWDDNQDPTEIDDSEHSKNVLKYCGFK